jgi:hypothetical protein
MIWHDAAPPDSHMKSPLYFTLRSVVPCFAALVAFSACKKDAAEEKTAAEEFQELAAEVKESTVNAAKGGDIPMLPLSVGDTWVYDVKVQIPEGVTADRKAVENASFERTRKFVGKVKPSADHPDCDCFEVSAPGSPTEREFIEVDDERIFMRGSGVVSDTPVPPLWLDPPVLLVRAGLLGGESMPPIELTDPRSGLKVRRAIQIIGRETLEAAGRSFDAIQILMTGKDGNEGNFELRRSIWFAPHYGIIKEEKTRYINDKVVIKESMTLKSLQMKIDAGK